MTTYEATTYEVSYKNENKEFGKGELTVKDINSDCSFFKKLSMELESQFGVKAKVVSALRKNK